MRVLHFAHGHPEIRKGGAEIAAYRIHQDLRGREGIHSIFIAAEFPWEMPVPDATFAPGPGPEEYFLASTGFEHFRSSRSDLGVIEATLVPFLLGLRPDVVHFHHYHLLGVELIPLVRRTLPGVKVVVHLHEMYAICPRNGHMFLPESGELCDRAVPSRCAGCFPHEGAANLKLRELFLRSTLDQADLFLTPSEFVRQRYVDWGISAKKIRVQENGMPAAPPALPRRPDAGRRRTRFGFFGQLYRHKGVLLLLEAFEDLVARGTTDAELHLHGCLNAHHDPEFNQAFSQKLEETSAPVHFHGPYPSEQVTQLMESVDWVLVPSLWWENSPLTILEARSARRPVICGDIGGMAEKVRDGVTGLHFRTGDRSALTEVLDRAASTDGLWEELRENITPGPGSSEIGDELLAFYAALIEGRAAPTDLRTNALASPPNAEAPRIEAREPGEGASEDAPGRWLFTSPLIEQVGSETFLTGILEGPGLAERPPRAPRFVGLHWIPGGTAQPPLPSSEVEELLSGTQVHLPKAAGSGDEAPAVQVRLRLPLALASLPASAHLEVRVATEEGPPRPAASLRLDHTPLAPRTRERRTPILFSGIGRTGGTITFRHLLEHPEILVIPKYPYETRVAVYWMQVRAVLEGPADDVKMPNQHVIQVDRHRVGTNPFLRHGLSEGLLPGPGDEVAAWTASQILRTYDHVATRSEKPRATFFAEKNAGLFLPNMFRTSFAGLREVFLMRDIRDVLCSIVAFDRKRGFPMGCSYDSLDDLGRKILRTFWIQYHTYCERVPEEERFFHRYEDFMQRPEEALRKLFDFLGVDSSPDTIRRVHRAATDDQGLVDIHTTSSSATASIGRWKTELAELKDPECLESIERFCRTCDYPLQASSAEAVSSR